VNGLTVKEMDKESKNGSMAHDTKVNGETVKLTVKESSITPMVISMREIG